MYRVWERKKKKKKKLTNEIIKQKILRLQHKIRVLQTEEVERNLKAVKQNFFENANKPGRWLAYRLRKERQKNQINILQEENGEETYRLQEMKKITEQFLKLYIICKIWIKESKRNI